ncbi:dTDP-4-dehydrorhamnose 3,5-epimerase [Leptolyngbya sp. FACHB-711]|uniref:dTDP-4-dehydrorhamnose 3,5-epimerase n=1 Tax=unclassified Leptolyngbya TaxID=2650499 RepID=UPI0018F04171|nr:dTDP-4-dehydrorhamnose 3,5-epimerase [Leptolyngbya sp. FACHB-711]
MSLVRQVKVRRLDAMKSGMVEFYTLQSSHETMLAQIPGRTVDDLFVHHFHTDQLLVVRGEIVLVILSGRQYHYFPLSEAVPQVVTIPPGVPHGSINFSDQPCMFVNAVLRHGKPHERDYRPLRKPFPYDVERAKAALETIRPKAIHGEVIHGEAIQNDACTKTIALRH